MKYVFRILKFAKPFRKDFAVISVFVIIIAVSKQITPWITKLVSDYVERIYTGELTSAEVLDKVFILLAIAFVFSFLNWLSNRMSWRQSMILQEKMRGHLRMISFEKLLYQDLAYFDNQTSGNILSKVDRGISRIVNQIGEAATFFLPNILAAIIAVILIVQVNWQYVALMLVGFVPFTLINMWAIKRHEPLERRFNRAYDDEYGHFYEVISSMKLVKSFSRMKYELSRLSRYNTKIVGLTRQIERVWDKASIKDLLLDSWVWMIRAYLIIDTINGSMSLGTFFFLVQYTNILREPFWNLTWMYFEFKKMTIGARDLLKILDSKTQIEDKPDAKIIFRTKGRIQFENVDFAYSKGKKVIDGMSFVINPGETIALVGRSGSGKTTIANLLNRFYDVTAGRILLDFDDIRDISRDSLRGVMGMVLQESYLFDETIEENLRYGKKDATEAEMIQACKYANAWEFILNLDKKLKTKIGERGIKLSGGQKQRLSIARTILKDPDILILDEATSSLDSQSEIKVQEALWNMIGAKTAIIIAHRLSTIRKADRIFVIDKGRIQEQGSHKELLDKSGIYAKLYQLQSQSAGRELLKEYELG